GGIVIRLAQDFGHQFLREKMGEDLVRVFLASELSGTDRAQRGDQHDGDDQRRDYSFYEGESPLVALHGPFTSGSLMTLAADAIGSPLPPARVTFARTRLR